MTIENYFTNKLINTVWRGKKMFKINVIICIKYI